MDAKKGTGATRTEFAYQQVYARQMMRIQMKVRNFRVFKKFLACTGQNEEFKQCGACDQECGKPDVGPTFLLISPF